jgi:hypothetical protein
LELLLFLPKNENNHLINIMLFMHQRPRQEESITDYQADSANSG